MPEALRHATAVSRPLRVECRGDRLTISDPGGGKPRVIEVSGNTEAAIDPLVSAVWDQVQTWGIAGQNMYWHPVLSCDVMADGQGRFADLQKLLDGSGLEVKWREPGRAAVRRPAWPRR